MRAASMMPFPSNPFGPVVPHDAPHGHQTSVATPSRRTGFDAVTGRRSSLFLPLICLSLGLLGACGGPGGGKPATNASRAGTGTASPPIMIGGLEHGTATDPSAGDPHPQDSAQGQGGSHHTSQADTDSPASKNDQPPVTRPPLISETTPRYHPSCEAILAQGHPHRAGMFRYADPETTRPAAGRPHEDPVYQSCVTRVTDQAGQHPAQYWETQTPRRQAFNADASVFLLNARDGSWRVHDAHTGRLIKQLDHIHGVNAEPQWHATDPNRLHYLPNNGQGMQIHELRVDRNESRLLADLGPEIRRYWPQATHAWTVGQGSPSADGRYWCLLAEHPSADGEGWRPQGVFTWDMQTGRIVGTMPLIDPARGTSYRPSHVSTSPSGQYCLVAAPYPIGSRIYGREFPSASSDAGTSPYVQVSTEANDADMALNRQGDDIYVSVDYNHGQGAGEVYMVNLRTRARTPLFDSHIGGTIGGLQFSGRAHETPGWILVSSHAERTHGPDASAWVRNLRHEHPHRQWHHRKLFAISLDPVGGKPEVRSIANMHNDWWLPDPTQIHSWPTPNATVSRDFSRILFNSTWNSSNPKDVDTYLVSIPARSLDQPPAP